MKINKKQIKELQEELKKYKFKVRKFKMNKPGGTFMGYKEYVKIPFEDFEKIFKNKFGDNGK